MDWKTEYMGLTLSSPMLLSSGEASNGFEKISAAIQAGAGAVITPSIRLTPMVQPQKDIDVLPGGLGLLNAQGHSSIPWEEWVKEILPAAKKAGYTVIAKTGYTLEDVEALVPKLTSAGAAGIEIIAPTSDLMARMICAAKQRTNLPVSAKVSGRWPDLEEVARNCVNAGADGLTVMDTIGPALRLDTRTGEPSLDGENRHGKGFGWLSGTAILPVTLAYVAKLRRSNPGLSVAGVGGVTSGGAAMQMLLAGATVVGVQSAVIAEGPGAIARILKELESELKTWDGIDRARGYAQRFI